MTRSRIRTVSLIGVLVLAVAAFAYFGVVRQQPRESGSPAIPAAEMKMQAPASPPDAAQGNSIFVAPEKQQLIGMHSVAAEMGMLTKEIRITGKVTYDETHQTHIHSKVSGYIEEVFADSVGKQVRAGDPLFTMYSPDLLATQQDFLLALKSRDLLRGSTVASAATGSENLIAAARERLRLWDVTDMDIEDLERDGKVKRAITVYSPVSGVVMERAAYHHGTFVDPSKELFMIVDLSHVWILGEVYEADLPLIRTGQSAQVELPYSGGGRRFNGRVDFVYPFLDPKTHTAQVRMEFPNADLTLKPEMYTNITLSAALGRQVLIPQDALMDTGSEQYVFIDKGNGYVEPRRVKASGEAGDKVGIQEGLKSGEKVVTGANFIVDSESRLKGAFAGMGTPTQPPASATPATQSISVEVLEPKTAKTGMNAVRLLVKDASGKPITGAQVEVGLFMPQMGAMPPMNSKGALTEVGNGIYSGQVEVLMAWTWQTTVTVRKNGAVIGAAQTTITSR